MKNYIVKMCVVLCKMKKKTVRTCIFFSLYNKKTENDGENSRIHIILFIFSKNKMEVNWYCEASRARRMIILCHSP